MKLAFDDIGGWPGVFSRLFGNSDLSADEASCAFNEILEGRATPSQIGAFVAALRTKGETIEEMTGLVGSMRDHCEVVSLNVDAIDTCGTGGDRSGTINVSTAAALVIATAGAKVCKHGGRAASSLSGSADVLEALGVAIELGPGGVARCVEEVGIGFCFAPRYHSAMRHAIPVRKELGVATVFNFLGPLANPARVSRQVVGVGDATMAEKLLGVLEANGARHAMVVFGHDGMDELSTVAVSSVLETFVDSSGKRHQRSYEIDPAMLGLAPSELSNLRGGDATQNAELLRAIVSGHPGRQRDIVALNAAAGLIVSGRVDDFEAGLELAEATLTSGAVRDVLERFIAVSQSARKDEQNS